MEMYRMWYFFGHGFIIVDFAVIKIFFHATILRSWCNMFIVMLSTSIMIVNFIMIVYDFIYKVWYSTWFYACEWWYFFCVAHGSTHANGGTFFFFYGATYLYHLFRFIYFFFEYEQKIKTFFYFVPQYFVSSFLSQPIVSL